LRPAIRRTVASPILDMYPQRKQSGSDVGFWFKEDARLRFNEPVKQVQVRACRSASCGISGANASKRPQRPPCCRPLVTAGNPIAGTRCNVQDILPFQGGVLFHGQTYRRVQQGDYKTPRANIAIEPYGSITDDEAVLLHGRQQPHEHLPSGSSTDLQEPIRRDATNYGYANINRSPWCGSTRLSKTRFIPR
jgi:hypothetical protein